MGGEIDMIKEQLLQDSLGERQNEQADLLVSKRKIQALLAANPDLIISVRDDGTYLEIIEPQGWAPFDLHKLKNSKTIFDHLSSSLANIFLASIQQAIVTGQRQIFAYNIFWDHTEWSRECHVVMIDEQSALLIIRDITDRKNMEFLLSHIVEKCSNASGVVLFQSLTKYLTNYLNVKLAVVGEYDATTKLFTILAGVRANRKIKFFSFPIEGTVLEPVVKGEELFIKENAAALYPLDSRLQQIKTTSIVAVPLRDSTNTVIGAIALSDDKPLSNIRLVSNLLKLFSLRVAAEMERLQTKRNLQNMAVTDELTHMPNRWYLQQEMGRLLTLSGDSGVTAAFLFINLDRFSLINDALGHVKGDWLIKLLANRLLRVMEERQGLVCRFGGDEFVIVLANLHFVDEVESFAAELLELLHEPLLIDNEAYSVGASIGVSLFPQDGTDGQHLLQNADIAMNVAKQSGRNQCQFYHDALQQTASFKLEMENRLRQAVQKNHFVLHYQPQYSIESGQVVGMEALVRWQLSDKQLIAPAEFIPLAEETGLIIPLGTWVLQEACRQNKEWQLKGYQPVRVAVNISPVQFQTANFIEIVRKTLLVTGLDAKWLEIEFTEGLTMEKSGVVLDHMKSLSAMGVYMSIDDFGTGYSSLNYLKSFPIQALKIDRSFVAGMTVDESDSAIISAIIAMGKSLNLSIIAEGIETEDQLQLLKEQKCHLVQGFLFSKPLAASDFEECILADT
jgi:diguanylate cyclase (GGDEF)-like protein